MYKRLSSYYKAHPDYNSIIHFVAGAGFGILITYPVIGEHPVRWGIGLLTVGILGVFYAYNTKK